MRKEIKFIFLISNSSEFKEKLKIGNNPKAEYDAKFINIAELLTKKPLSGIRFR
jgi:hypothetical protein